MYTVSAAPSHALLRCSSQHDHEHEHLGGSSYPASFVAGTDVHTQGSGESVGEGEGEGEGGFTRSEKLGQHWDEADGGDRGGVRDNDVGEGERMHLLVQQLIAGQVPENMGEEEVQMLLLAIEKSQVGKQHVQLGGGGEGGEEGEGDSVSFDIDEEHGAGMRLGAQLNREEQGSQQQHRENRCQSTPSGEGRSQPGEEAGGDGEGVGDVCDPCDSYNPTGSDTPSPPSTQLRENGDSKAASSRTAVWQQQGLQRDEAAGVGEEEAKAEQNFDQQSDSFPSASLEGPPISFAQSEGGTWGTDEDSGSVCGSARRSGVISSKSGGGGGGGGDCVRESGVFSSGGGGAAHPPPAPVQSPTSTSHGANVRAVHGGGSSSSSNAPVPGGSTPVMRRAESVQRLRRLSASRGSMRVSGDSSNGGGSVSASASGGGVRASGDGVVAAGGGAAVLPRQTSLLDQVGLCFATTQLCCPSFPTDLCVRAVYELFLFRPSSSACGF